MKNFKKLKVWEKGMDIVERVYKLTNTLPYEERLGLVIQMNRSAVSIPSNIAEGSSRYSQKEYKHFLRISLGSCFELETQILIVEKLNLYSKSGIGILKNEIDEEEKMLMSFIKAL